MVSGVEKLKRELVYFSVLFGKYIHPFFPLSWSADQGAHHAQALCGQTRSAHSGECLASTSLKSSPETLRSSVGARLARDGVRPDLSRYRKKTALCVVRLGAITAWRQTAFGQKRTVLIGSDDLH